MSVVVIASHSISTLWNQPETQVLALYSSFSGETWKNIYLWSRIGLFEQGWQTLADVGYCI